jgi:tRNA dimethylallyltransferase
VSGPALHLLTGCTASGKTEWALRWAEAAGAEIISCDSLLFYTGMDLGTAKPTPAERARVPHHLIDILPLAEPMNVSRYVELAQAAAAAIRSRGRPVLVVGGSGFYLKAFFAAVTDAVPVPPAVREAVAARLAAAGLPALVAELRSLNPDGLGNLDVANPRRVARALERCLASGRPLRDLAEDFARQPAAFAGWQRELTRLDWPEEELNRRIAVRVERMLASGLVEEVRGLLAQGLEANPSAARGIGYREVIALLQGRLAPENLAAEIIRNTRALVKKQRTWFRTQLPPHRVVPAASLVNSAELFSPLSSPG